MALNSLFFSNGLFSVGRTGATPCVDSPDETIDGFPELDVTVENIKDPVAKQKLQALAKRIVASQGTSDRIIGFEVHGHADVDLRVPAGADRTQTELDVSVDRAENARDLLLQMISDSGGKPFMQGIKANATALGVGSRCRKVVPARTDAEMKRNRRVEIFLKVLKQQPTPPKPPAPPPGPKPSEPGTRWKIQITGGVLATAPSPVGDILGFATMRLNVTITDLDRRRKANFIATSTGITVSGSTGSLAGVTLILPGKPQEFKTRQVAALEQFPGALVLGQNPSIGPAILSAGGDFAFTFDALPFGTNPSTVDVGFAGDDLTGQGVQVSWGIAPATGSLKMVGQPSSQ
jgi:hypothetical protein